MAIIGIVLAIVGLMGFFGCVYWMYWVTTTSHHPLTILGHFWSTFGQEVVAFSMLVLWCWAIYGGFLILEVPNTWQVTSLFILIFLPTAIIWLIAKAFAIRDIFIILEYRWLKIFYTVTLVWVSLTYFGMLTFIPSGSIQKYYGNFKNSAELIWRVKDTIVQIDQIRFFRSEVEDRDTALRFLKESLLRMDDWHSKRESWGAQRALEKSDYIDQTRRWVAFLVVVSAFSKDKDAFWGPKIMTMLFCMTDMWWFDDPSMLPSKGCGKAL